MSDTPVTAPADADDAPDQPISTADFQADPEPASEASDKQEAAEAVVESGEPASEGDATSELDSLKAQIEALTNKLAEKEAAEKEAAEKAEKVAALNEAGIPDTFARFISGDKDSWAEQIAALTTLREQASPAPAPSIPRDPAVDADLETEDEGLTEALSFFGISN
jgi:hypothetical protein